MGRTARAPSSTAGRRRGGSPAGAAAAGPVAVHVVFTTAALFDDWFSHWHEGFRAAVVSMPGPGTARTVDPRAFVAYELVQHGLRLSAPRGPRSGRRTRSPAAASSTSARTGRASKLKLLTTELCPSCEAALAAAGIPMDRLRRLLEVIRTLAAPAVVVH